MFSSKVKYLNVFGNTGYEKEKKEFRVKIGQRPTNRKLLARTYVLFFTLIPQFILSADSKNLFRRDLCVEIVMDKKNINYFRMNTTTTKAALSSEVKSNCTWRKLGGLHSLFVIYTLIVQGNLHSGEESE